MTRLKIDYGIDLGTTNSAICRMDRGEVNVIKCDTTDDTMPSCVQFTKRKGIKVGKTAYNALKSDKRSATKTWETEDSNIFIEFKREMGTDVAYKGSYMDAKYTPEQLSAEVLKTLKSFVSDDEVSSVVITVPAMFKMNQKDATIKAAKLAGFSHCELLQEPIAAAMAYGLSANQKDGYWLVFDFGGGTFDAALLKVEDGIMQVFDTEGNNYLGGKDLDNAMVERIIIPYLQKNNLIDEILADTRKRDILKAALKTYAEETKNQLSFKDSYDIITNLGDLGEDDEGNEIELDLTITQEQIEGVFSPVFQEAIDICKKLLERNKMGADKLDKIILVGGPTHSPVLRGMLKEQFGNIIDTSIDPMTVVAKGAALYASTLDNSVKTEIEMGTIALSVAYEATTVETIEVVTVKLNTVDSVGDIPTVLKAKVSRSDGAWTSELFELTERGDVVDCLLQENKSNSFMISVFDEMGNPIPCAPNEFTIIQGSKIGSATIPYNIGIEVWNEETGKAVFKSIKGLEKNKTLPATGIENGLKTSNDIRPGLATDFIKIPIYQAEYAGDGLPAVYFQYVSEIRLSGDNLPAFLPAGSDIELTVKVDRSENLSVDIYIPQLDHTEEIEVHTLKETITRDYLKDEIDKAHAELRRLKKEGTDVEELDACLDQVEQGFKDGNEEGKILKGLRDTLQEAARKDKSGEWDRYDKKLDAALSMLAKDNEKYGNAETSKQVEEIRRQVSSVKSKHNISMAKELLDLMHALNFKLATVEYFVSWILDWDMRFAFISWRNRNQARQLIDSGKTIVMDKPTAERLRPIVHSLIELLPQTEMPAGAEGLLTS